MSSLEKPHFHILACIDGSTESYRGLRYALKFSARREDTDISLIYVRAAVKLATGGADPRGCAAKHDGMGS